MAIPLSRTTLFSTVCSHFQRKGASHLPQRGYHIDLGAREKALMEEDPALRRFKSYKNSVKRVSKLGDVLTVITIAVCSYEIYAVSTRK